MNLKRALWISAVIYILSLGIGLILMFSLGINAFQPNNIPNTFYYISILASVILTALFTLLYFKNKKVKPSLKEGFMFGIVLIVVGFILDLLVFLTNYNGSGAEAMKIYYSNPLFWITLILLLLTTSLVGWIKGKK